MADTTERIIFRIRVERMLSKYSKEDQENIRKEIEEILKLLNDDIISMEIIILIIHYYFKFEKKD